jgi:hypothetical protein
VDHSLECSDDQRFSKRLRRALWHVATESAARAKRIVALPGEMGKQSGQQSG